MDQPTITVTETPIGGDRKAPSENPRAADSRRSQRPHEVVSSVVGQMGDKPKSQGSPGGAVHVTNYSKSPAGRSFTEHQKQMLANLDRHGDVRGPGDNAGTTVTVREGNRVETPAERKPEAEAAKPADPTPSPSPAAAPPAAEPAKPDAKVEAKPETPPAEAKPDADIASRLERMTEHNRRLSAEVEQLRSGKHEPDERLKALDEIEELWTTDTINALRKMVALNAGLKPDSADVDRLLSHAYAEWTGHELKVPLDPGKRAEIGSDRNRLLIERDRRKRDADAKAAAAAGEAEQNNQRVTTQVNSLGERLKTEEHGKKFPLMMDHSQMFDGLRPEQLLFSVIRRGIAAGEFDKDTPDDKLVAHYSAEIEKYYKPRYDKLESHFKTKLEPYFKEKLTPPQTAATSTATPAQASESKTDPAADTHQAGVRTITNASASVAPPAPPAVVATPPAKDPSPAPKFRNEDERRRHFARLRFGDE